MSSHEASSGERYKNAPEQVQAKPREGTFLDWGPDLPEHINQDVIYGLARDPNAIFFYWELTGPRQDKIKAERGPGFFDHGFWQLIIHDLTADREHLTEVSTPVGSHYADTHPRSTYVGKIGWRTTSGEFILFSETPPINTPADAPSNVEGNEFWTTEEIKKLLASGPAGRTRSSLDVRSSLMLSRSDKEQGGR